MADCVCLISVVSGNAYHRFAEGLFDSARKYLRPSCEVRTVVMPGRSGWPDATLYRYHVLHRHVAGLPGEWLFLCDADMRFESDVGDEILGDIVATRHPGYVGKEPRDLPYETRPESAAYIGEQEGSVYYAGGFVGGEREAFLGLVAQIVTQIELDKRRDIVARWHDESHLNRVLAWHPPTVTLSPSYCYPDDDTYYRTIWPERYERKLVALDKSPSERGER